MMQGSDSFRLIVRRGPQPNQSYDLNKDIVTLGRDITNDIVINDPEVSRHHMRLTRGAGGFTVEDLGSTNGTFVNGQRLTGARPLRPGDMIGLGETVTLAYEMSAAPTIAEPSGDQPGGTVVSPAAQRPGAQQYPVSSSRSSRPINPFSPNSSRSSRPINPLSLNSNCNRSRPTDSRSHPMPLHPQRRPFPAAATKPNMIPMPSAKKNRATPRAGF